MRGGRSANDPGGAASAGGGGLSTRPPSRRAGCLGEDGRGKRDKKKKEGKKKKKGRGRVEKKKKGGRERGGRAALLTPPQRARSAAAAALLLLLPRRAARPYIWPPFPRPPPQPRPLPAPRRNAARPAHPGPAPTRRAPPRPSPSPTAVEAPLSTSARASPHGRAASRPASTPALVKACPRGPRLRREGGGTRSELQLPSPPPRWPRGAGSPRSRPGGGSGASQRGGCSAEHCNPPQSPAAPPGLKIFPAGSNGVRLAACPPRRLPIGHSVSRRTTSNARLKGKCPGGARGAALRAAGAARRLRAFWCLFYLLLPRVCIIIKHFGTTATRDPGEVGKCRKECRPRGLPAKRGFARVYRRGWQHCKQRENPNSGSK